MCNYVIYYNKGAITKTASNRTLLKLDVSAMVLRIVLQLLSLSGFDHCWCHSLTLIPYQYSSHRNCLNDTCVRATSIWYCGRD